MVSSKLSPAFKTVCGDLLTALKLSGRMNTVSLWPGAGAQSIWLAPARAVEGQEQWKTANVENQAVLLYNDIDDEADGPLQQIAPPQRIDPPKPSAAHESGMQSAERQMMMISGQFQAQMGENDTQSAASGKAIGQRKQQGDTATYHFVEHSADMLRFIGVQLLDLYPKIYDTRRALHLEGDDGERMWIKIDPDQTEAVEEINNAGGAKNPAFKFVCGGGIGILLGVGLFLALNICGVNFGNMETIVILGIPCCLGLMSSYIIF